VFLTTRRAAPSQPLSTLETNGSTWLPSSGQVRRVSPVAGSYQLKYRPLGSWCSIPARVVSVRVIRAVASAAEMMPRSRATMVDHR
jgi:hypothetical protein